MRRWGRGTALGYMLVLQGLGLLLTPPAYADQCPIPPPPGCHGSACDIEFYDCGPGGSGGPGGGGTGGGGGGSPDPHPPIEVYVVACTGNTPVSTPDATCNAATQSCPKPEDTRYWVWVRTWNGEHYTEPALRTTPQSVCLGPEEVAQRADPTTAVAALVRSEWRSFGLPGATVQTQPGGETLVGAITRFSTPTPPSAKLAPKQILGLDVTLSIKASRYVWDFGDGTTLEAAAEGDQPRAEHTYRAAGPMNVTLRTYYSATFTIEGSEVVYPLEGTADVPGEPTSITAREARTQLEGG